ncbi:MAG: SulP family inorganic anion transporter, partial [Saprospiraceae bacterium]|nr:SulP family inorganic anion transporter [Saprospiraceae bacterium]
TNLLTGVLAGLAVSITFILIGNLKNSYYFKEHAEQPDKVVSRTLAEEVSFLNKAAIRTMLANIAPDKKVIIDATNTEYIDYDVLEIIKEFQSDIAPSKNISVVLIGFKEYYSIDQTEYVASPDPTVLPAHMKA